MLLKLKLILFFICLPFLVEAKQNFSDSEQLRVEVTVVGGGVSGTMAAIQAARMGSKTLLIEKTEWLGGMLTSAGVSAIDGNHNLPSGLWAEFRQKLYDHYGGPKKVETGWVSNTLFEPAVAAAILEEMAKHPNLTVWKQTSWRNISSSKQLYTIEADRGGEKNTTKTSVLIDATELGDVAAALGVSYSIGMDARTNIGEPYAPRFKNDIVQDLTYVLTLKDYGTETDKTIEKPAGYDSEKFRCACSTTEGDGLMDCDQMLAYGKLPNGKFMLNWPNCGNDLYLNVIEKTPRAREELLKKAKNESLQFLYYIQTELGYKNIGLAEGEYPSEDGLPLIPYHRESRRIEGMVRLTVPYLEQPFGQEKALYRTGIAVGDYPIDHHHKKNPSAPEIDFIKIKVPAYNVPLGVMIPRKVDNLIVAEKSIGVSNIVNGTTRLQPVVMGIGQAAGALAHLAAQGNTTPANVPVRKVQKALLEADAYIMPYFDVQPIDREFEIVQRIGATGIIRGEGVPYKWANQTWFYPDRDITEYELYEGLSEYYPLEGVAASGEMLSLERLAEMLATVNDSITTELLLEDWDEFNMEEPITAEQHLSRWETAFLIDYYLDPFSIPVDVDGNTVKQDNTDYDK